jgi:hypothetical protein
MRLPGAARLLERYNRSTAKMTAVGMRLAEITARE